MVTSMLNIIPSSIDEKLGWPWLEETNTTLYNNDIEYPKITIITPSFNQGKYLEETIRSVLLQNYPNLEYIIIDGGSSDSSVEIIKKYQKYLSYWVSEKDNGQSHAINKGLIKVTGDIITWINSDDFYKPETLLIVANEFIKNSVCNCVIGKSHVFGEGKSYLAKSPIFESVEKTIGFGRIVQPAMFFHASTYKQIGLLNENLQYLLDTEWWLKYLMVYGQDKIVEIETPLVNFRLHSYSKTSSQYFGFIKERDSLYFSIAIQNKLEKLAKTINSLGYANHTYSFSFPEKTNKEFIEKAINYFLLLRGNEYYVNFENKTANVFFSVINTKLLLNEDVIFLKKIKFRNNFIPNFIIKTLRRK